MNLIFEQTKERRQCGIEVVVNGFKVQCTFSSSTTVTIPTGLHYFDGKLNFSQSMLRTTLAICKNHQMQLTKASRDLQSKAL
jgi:hypothetical protein